MSLTQFRFSVQVCTMIELLLTHSYGQNVHPNMAVIFFLYIGKFLYPNERIILTMEYHYNRQPHGGNFHRQGHQDYNDFR